LGKFPSSGEGKAAGDDGGERFVRKRERARRGIATSNRENISNVRRAVGPRTKPPLPQMNQGSSPWSKEGLGTPGTEEAVRGGDYFAGVTAAEKKEGKLGYQRS